MRKKPLIIGIDPGTTTAIAFLDADGDPLETRSSKKYSKKRIIREIREKGSLMILGTDKNPLPSSIQEVASKFKCKVYVPEEDLPREKKSSLTENYKQMISNEHEKDALAAAIQAHKFYRKQLRKIKRRNSGKYEEVVRRELLGIKKKSKKRKQRETEGKTVKTLEREKRYREEIKNLKEKLKKLRNKLKIEKKEKEEFKKQLDELKVEKGIKERENYLKSNIEKLKHEKKKLKEKIGEIIESIDEGEIKTMTEEELEKEKYTQSRKKFQELKEKGKEAHLVKVIHEKSSEKDSMNKIYYREVDHSEKSKDTLRKIIENYKRNRK
ncbi:MAG: DUF460 domain-containing protein [archaeon]